MRKFRLVVVLFCVSFAGCMSSAYVQHPGSANLFDSQAYDTVVTTQAVIDQARTDLTVNTFSPTISAKMKTVLDSALIPAYNALYAAYVAYHTTALTDPSTTQVPLQTAITQVNTATTNLAAAKAGQ
jgi:hypothetical protein